MRQLSLTLGVKEFVTEGAAGCCDVVPQGAGASVYRG